MNSIQILSKSSMLRERFHLNSSDFDLFAHATKSESLTLNLTGKSVYFFIQEGSIEFSRNSSTYKLGPGHYGSQTDLTSLIVHKNSYAFIIISPARFKPLNTIGGPVESLGRLKYIDGCSDTILLPPATLSEPCLNYLHFPENTKQTMHNHPSFRFGIVTKGNGMSVSENEENPLMEGDIFFIPPFFNHKFDTSQSIMDVIAFHPDSDWGPTDEVHPMINRTWVNGKKI